MSDVELSPIKRALLEQRRLKARVQELERVLAHPTAAPIAVIGVGCRFPGASGPAEFWKLLENGVDAISDMPGNRWDVATRYDPDPEAPGKIATRFGGYLRDVDAMDPKRLGISPREAATMDPQQRILLEVAWEALEHAGLATDSLTGASMGVFVGIGPNDYAQLYAQRGAVADIDAYLATGNANSVASGRISYLLGVHGPSVSVDTACSSSLVAVQLACESIRAGSCDSAIAGGVGILLGEQNYVSLSKARMMAPDGRCKAFDSRADGFVRSEGCGVVILKRLSDAQRDGDRVLAVIRGGAINQDGRSNGITAPNGPAQQAVIRAAHANAGTSPARVSFVEAHGTGTALGDPIEVESLGAVLSVGREASQPLYLGSVKTNIGHAEAAAGVAGLIKTVLALHNGTIPPNLHFRAPNPHIGWDAFPFLRIPTAATPWTSTDGPRTAGVSAFGFSGTNVHLVLEEAPVDEVASPTTAERPLHVLALSAKTDAALRVAAGDLAPTLAPGSVSLGDFCYSVNTGRASFERRLAAVSATIDDLRAKLERVASGETSANVARQAGDDGPPRVLFAMPSLEAEQLRLSSTLFATQPEFRRTVEEASAFVPPEYASLLRAIAGGDIGRVFEIAQSSERAVTELVVGCALARMWEAWGIAPAAVVGHGTGELAARVVAGTFSLEDAIRVATGAPRARDTDNAPAPRVPVFSASVGRRLTADEIRAASSLSEPATAAAWSSTIALAAHEGFTAVVDMSVLEWRALASALVELFERGLSVDWRGFDRGYARRRVDVPALPWMRERYWFDDNRSAPSVAVSPVIEENPEAMWMSATQAAARQATLVPVDVELSRYAQAWTELDAFTTNAIAKALLDLGLFTRAGESHSVDSAMRAGNVQPVYRHLLSLWLQRLVRHGELVQTPDGYAAHATHALQASPSGKFGPASDAFPVLQSYLRRCEHAIAAIVTGRQSPLDLLFPDGSLETADFFYRHWGLARYYNAILESTSRAIIQQANGRPLRVLEIGAGTGGTASALAPLFGNAGAEYWFTDVSEYFFGRAEEAFANIPSMRYVRFDVDGSPREQSIPLGQFDLVVASNAVHAAKNLGQAIEHARSLLAPNGMLMLYEATTHLDWFEMSIALIEGWQHHIDDLRGETPLLTPEQWAQALTARGFDRVAQYPDANSPAGLLGHHIIIASVPTTAVERTDVATPTLAQARADVTTTCVIGAVTPAVSPTASATGAAPSAGATNAARESLASLTHGERVESMRELVQRQVKKVMRLRADAPPPGTNDRLMSAGMDSLMAVELRKLLTTELGGAVTLPSTLIFDYPTIGAIVTLILDQLDLGELAVAAPTVGTPAAAVPKTAAALANLSDAEVEAMLLENLNGLAK
jgi:3-oxoacyl-(acyl-carrier-protein) synthase/SAM-dependent methyltransferase